MTIAERWEQQGIEKGVRQGMQQGVKQGMQQGVEKERRALAQKLQEAGQSPDFVEQMTGLRVKALS